MAQTRIDKVKVEKNGKWATANAEVLQVRDNILEIKAKRGEKPGSVKISLPESWDIDGSEDSFVLMRVPKEHKRIRRAAKKLPAKKAAKTVAKKKAPAKAAKKTAKKKST